jgi:hypothetical protein
VVLNVREFMASMAEDLATGVMEKMLHGDGAGREGEADGLPKKLLERLRSDPNLRKQMIASAVSDALPKDESIKDAAAQLASSKINDWSDLYHYFPYLAPHIRIWKLAFKEEIGQQEAEEFEGCVSPAALIDMIIPDVEEVRRYDRSRAVNLHRNYHRLKKL